MVYVNSFSLSHFLENIYSQKFAKCRLRQPPLLICYFKFFENRRYEILRKNTKIVTYVPQQNSDDERSL